MSLNNLLIAFSCGAEGPRQAKWPSAQVAVAPAYTFLNRSMAYTHLHGEVNNSVLPPSGT